MYIDMRTKVKRRPVARMCSSVAQWWRARVKVESGAASTKDR